jgi:hypothetical protein
MSCPGIFRAIRVLVLCDIHNIGKQVLVAVNVQGAKQIDVLVHVQYFSGTLALLERLFRFIFRYDSAHCYLAGMNEFPQLGQKVRVQFSSELHFLHDFRSSTPHPRLLSVIELCLPLVLASYFDQGFSHHDCGALQNQSQLDSITSRP